LYVQPAYRGVGLGRALFARVAAIAAERGCPRMEWAVLDWNTPAIDFYRALGATAMDEWTVYRLTGPALAAAATARQSR
jgi:GNAT superfamily N-acetyltransferase